MYAASRRSEIPARRRACGVAIVAGAVLTPQNVFRALSIWLCAVASADFGDVPFDSAE
jgi:hypothetical protein